MGIFLDHIHVVHVLKSSKEVDDVFMFKCRVKLNFSIDLQAGGPMSLQMATTARFPR